MQATSPEQLLASETGEVPPVENVRDDVIAIPQRMPRGHIPYSLSYVVIDAEHRAHVIDPGWDTDENWVRLVGSLAGRGLAPEAIASITVTHFHQDHGGMAERTREASGAPIVAHRLEQASMANGRTSDRTSEAVKARLEEWGVPQDRRAEFELGSATSAPFRPPPIDRVVDDGDRLDAAGADLRVVWTPGHTGGHICLVDTVRGLIYTGDHLLPTMFPGLGLGGPTLTNPVADYVTSLEAIGEYDTCEVLPGHGYRFRGLLERATTTTEHHLRRSGEVASVLAAGDGLSTWEVASRLTWTAGWAGLRGFLLYSALAQTAMHRDYVASPEYVGRSRDRRD